MNRAYSWDGGVKSMVGAVLVVVALPVFSATTFCEARARQAEGKAVNFHPTVESRVTQTAGAWLHSAPHARCRISAEFIKLGVALPAYSLYRGWVYVMVVRADGETPMGWIRERDLALLKPYGASPENTSREANTKMKVLP